MHKDTVISELSEIISAVKDEQLILTEAQYKKYKDAMKQLKKVFM